MRAADTAADATSRIRRERLRRIIEEKSYLTGGDFTLASGAESHFFFDTKTTTLHPEGASLVGDVILEMIADQKVKAVGGLELGACPIVSAVCVKSHERGVPIEAFYVRKTPKKRGTQKMIEGAELLPGDRVAVLEDVTTAGGSVLQAVEEVARLGCVVVSIITLVDRLQGARRRIEDAGYSFASVFTKDDFPA